MTLSFPVGVSTRNLQKRREDCSKMTTLQRFIQKSMNAQAYRRLCLRRHISFGRGSGTSRLARGAVSEHQWLYVTQWVSSNSANLKLYHSGKKRGNVRYAGSWCSDSIEFGTWPSLPSMSRFYDSTGEAVEYSFPYSTGL